MKTPTQWKHILARLRHWHEVDNDWQKAVGTFSRFIAPDCYSPIINTKYAESYIDGVAGNNKELKDWLEYIIYEVPNMEGPSVEVKEKGKIWDFKKDEDIIDFLTEN